MTENQKDIERLGVSIAVLVGSPVTLTLTLTLLITLSLALALIAVRVGSLVTRVSIGVRVTLTLIQT